MIMHVTNKETSLKLIQTLYENRKHELYYQAFDILKDEEAAEDAVYHCICKLLEICDLYALMSYQQLEQLAHVLIRHLAYSMPAAQAPKPQSSSESYEDFIDDDLTLLALRYVYELKPYEIAKLTGVSTALIHKKLFISKNRFMNSLEQEK